MTGCLHGEGPVHLQTVYVKKNNYPRLGHFSVVEKIKDFRHTKAAMEHLVAALERLCRDETNISPYLACKLSSMSALHNRQSHLRMVYRSCLLLSALAQEWIFLSSLRNWY